MRFIVAQSLEHAYNSTVRDKGWRQTGQHNRFIDLEGELVTYVSDRQSLATLPEGSIVYTGFRWYSNEENYRLHDLTEILKLDIRELT